jgi:hypothetical protein
MTLIPSIAQDYAESATSGRDHQHLYTRDRIHRLRVGSSSRLRWNRRWDATSELPDMTSHPLHEDSGGHRFGEELDGARVRGRRSGRIIDVGRRNQDNRNVRGLPLQRATELVAVPIGQANVAQHDLELRLRERGRSLRHGPCFRDREPGSRQRARAEKSSRRIVFYQEQFRAIRHMSPPVG